MLPRRHAIDGVFDTRKPSFHAAAAGRRHDVTHATKKLFADLRRRYLRCRSGCRPGCSEAAPMRAEDDGRGCLLFDDGHARHQVPCRDILLQARLDERRAYIRRHAG